MGTVNYLDASLLNLITITFSLFFIGVFGIVNRRNNIILILISIELMFLSINANFIVFSTYLDDIFGQVFSLFVLTVAASEAAIALAILVVYYRLRNTAAVDSLISLKG